MMLNLPLPCTYLELFPCIKSVSTRNMNTVLCCLFGLYFSNRFQRYHVIRLPTSLGDVALICEQSYMPWWRIQMETFSAFLALCAGNSPVTGEFPAQRPVARSFDVSFDLRLNKRLSKQSWGWWSKTSSSSLWRHCNDNRACHPNGHCYGCYYCSLSLCQVPPTHSSLIGWYLSHVTLDYDLKQTQI